VGSKAGWIVAGIVVAALVTIVTLVMFFPPHSEPTAATLRQGFMDMQTIGADVALVIGDKQTDGGSATQDYQQAVELYQANAQALNTMIQAVADEKKIDPAAIDLAGQITKIVARGASLTSLDYCKTRLTKLDVTMWQTGTAGLTRLHLVLDALARTQLAAKDYPAAQETMLALFGLGRHMVDERALPYVVMSGLGAQQMACMGLMELYTQWEGHKDRVEGVRSYLVAVDSMMQTYTQKYQVVWNEKPDPGDVFNVIENDKDPTWRHQALLALGLVKFTAADHRGDVLYAKRLLDRALSSSDPLDVAAAKASLDLTRVEFNSVGMDKSSIDGKP
jgi:hypothetical protein